MLLAGTSPRLVEFRVTLWTHRGHLEAIKEKECCTSNLSEQLDISRCLVDAWQSDAGLRERPSKYRRRDQFRLAVKPLKPKHQIRMSRTTL